MNPPRDREVVSEIAEAVEAGTLEPARSLFERHPEQIECYTPYAGGTWLHFVAGSGCPELLTYLLGCGIDVNEGDRWDGTTALVSAAVHGRADNAKLLLDAGAVMDVSQQVRNPLFAASVAHEGGADVVRLLLDRDADYSIRYAKKRSEKEIDAMAWARVWGRLEVARLIAEKAAGGDPERVESLLAEADALAHAYMGGRQKA